MITPSAGRREVAAEVTVRANRGYWDAAADEYQAEHGDFLAGSGGSAFEWCPEGLSEAGARLLGEVTGRRVLEVGCGAAQCSRWLAARDARPVGIDLSHRELLHSHRLDAAAGARVPVVVADAGRLPFADGA